VTRRVRASGGGVLVGVLLLAVRVVWLALLGVVLLARVVLIFVVPRSRRSRYRQKHGRRHVDPDTGKSVPARSSVISGRQDRMVKAADRGRCVARSLGGCAGAPHGRWFWEIDHGVPWIAGGYTWFFNLFLLCFFHNQTKSNWNRDKDGYVHYRPSSYGGVNDPVLAEAIYECERRARWNLWRYVLAALAWVT
jgi:hypothetical protein